MKNYLLLFVFLYAAVQIQAQQYWTDIARTAIPTKVSAEQTLFPDAYRTVAFDFEGLQKELKQAQKQIPGEKISSDLSLLIPYPDGTNIKFQMVESPGMMEKISARYPSIKSYYGICEADPARSLRLVVSPLGIHGVCSGPEGQVYLDPIALREKSYTLSYYVSAYTKVHPKQAALGCGTLKEEIMEELEEEQVQSQSTAESSGEQVVERVYRMAIGATGEWTEQLYDTSIVQGLAAMNVVIARVNSIWERDLAIRGILIDDEDKLIQDNSMLDPYSNATSGIGLLGQNTGVINSIINSGDYDFGHVFTATCDDVGGIASLGSVCGANKAAGVTCHYSTNLDYVTVSIMSHEMGHQLNANHTFNNCGDNIAPSTAYEPGSGSTIMSYCGLCGSQNIQSVANDFYHSASLEEMYNFTQVGGGNGCSQKITSENIKPEVSFNHEPGFTIPILTPFKLSAEGFDENGDTLRYSFEQFNTGPVSPLGSPISSAPAFRVTYPHLENYRYLPRLQTVINNTSEETEVLQDISRDFTFRVVARDYNSTIGSASWDELKFKMTDEAGPFLVSYPNSADTLEVGENIEVTWDVANTDGELVNCQYVNISMSLDGGYTYPISLAEKVINDGSQEVIIPNELTTSARIKIEAEGNIFYDISNANFRIVEPAEPAYFISSTPLLQQACIPGGNSVEINTYSIQGYSSPLSFSATGLPSGAIATFSPSSVTPGEPVTMTIDMNGSDTTALISFDIIATSDDNDIIVQTMEMDIYSINYDDLALSTPALNAQGVEEAPQFTWQASMNAASYTIQIATNPSFSSSSILVEESGVVGTSFIPSVLLGKNLPVYWRIIPKNACGEGEGSEIFAFHTETLSCTVTSEESINLIIPAAQSTLEHTIKFFDDATINDLNVSNVDISYSPTIFLNLTLRGPNGQEVILTEGLCGNTTNLNIGFDSEAPTEVPCPPTDGFPHQPVGDLSVFEGADLLGNWTLKIKTTGSAFDPGRLNSWGLEICSNINQAGPELIHNELLPVKTGDAQNITSDYLLVTDANNGPDELIYTLVSKPQHGDVVYFGGDMPVGFQFKQSHIAAFGLQYAHHGNDATSDKFTFTVTDGEGGFIGITAFDISISPDNPVLGTSQVVNTQFQVFPNPASDQINLFFSTPVTESGMIRVYDIHGRTLAQINRSTGRDNYQIATENWATGFYLLEVSDFKGNKQIEKIIIQRD